MRHSESETTNVVWRASNFRENTGTEFVGATATADNVFVGWGFGIENAGDRQSNCWASPDRTANIITTTYIIAMAGIATDCEQWASSTRILVGGRSRN